MFRNVFYKKTSTDLVILFDGGFSHKKLFSFGSETKSALGKPPEKYIVKMYI
jgi:hypothetical protein